MVKKNGKIFDADTDKASSVSNKKDVKQKSERSYSVSSINDLDLCPFPHKNDTIDVAPVDVDRLTLLMTMYKDLYNDEKIDPELIKAVCNRLIAVIETV
jgi:hypothetical protein